LFRLTAVVNFPYPLISEEFALPSENIHGPWLSHNRPYALAKLLQTLFDTYFTVKVGIPFEK